jgi:hypothetical protein
MSDVPDAVADDPWHRFLETVLAGLREATRRIRGDLLEHFEGRTLWFGTERASLGGSRIPRETSISAALVEVLNMMRARQFVEGRPALPGLDLTHVECRVEIPRRHEAAIGDGSLNTDIMLCIFHDDLDLRIEAKNILKPSDVSSHYLTGEGLRRFDDVRSPYSSEKYGGMVAYIMDEDHARWRKEIRRALKAAEPRFAVRETTILGETFTTTRHDRVLDCREHGLYERRVTDVIHLTLAFDAKPALKHRQKPRDP